MCTIKELKEWLEQFPEDTKVEVLEEFIDRWAVSTRWVDLELSDLTDTWLYFEDSKTLCLGK